MILSPTFRSQLDAEPSVIVVVDRQRVISHLNRAWSVAAELANATGCTPDRVLGRPYLDFVLGPLKHQLLQAFERAAKLEVGPNSSAWVHGECNTPAQIRHLTTRISTVSQSHNGELDCYLVQNDLRVVGRLTERPLVERPIDSWRDPNGCIVQCGCCRRVRDPKTSAWLMSLELLRQSAHDTSHGLCPLCLESYYPDEMSPAD